MNLEEIETRIQSLIELRLADALIGRNTEGLIVQKLATVIKENTITKPNGSGSPRMFTRSLSRLPPWNSGKSRIYRKLSPIL